MATPTSRTGIYKHTGRFPGYWSMQAPEKRDSRGLSARRFGPDPCENGPAGVFRVAGVRWKGRNASPGPKAKGNEGDLRVRVSFYRPVQDRGGPVSCSSLVDADQPRRRPPRPCPGPGSLGQGYRIRNPDIKLLAAQEGLTG